MAPMRLWQLTHHRRDGSRDHFLHEDMMVIIGEVGKRFGNSVLASLLRQISAHPHERVTWTMALPPRNTHAGSLELLSFDTDDREWFGDCKPPVALHESIEVDVTPRDPAPPADFAADVPPLVDDVVTEQIERIDRIDDAIPIPIGLSGWRAR